MTTKAKVGAGNVTVTLNEQEYTMVPTLNAAQTTSRLNGGIRGAIDAVIKLDLDVITRVVQVGLGPKVTREIGAKLPDYIWQAGMTDSGGEIVSKCIEYLTLLSNGGRPMTPAEAGDDGDPQ